MTCICKSVTKDRAIYALGAKGEVLAVFSKDCPEHGLEVVSEVHYVRQTTQMWFTRAEMVQKMLFLRKQEGLRLVEVSADQQRGLLEWVVWVPTPRAQFADKVAT
ncbi:hypothetical protein [Microcystis phage Mwe-JY26]